MLPSPATTRWSSSAAFRLVFLLAQERASMAASNSLPSGSGPRPFRSGSAPPPPRAVGFHIAEAARVVENDGRARGHVKHDMVVCAIIGPGMMELARSVRLFIRDKAKRPGHAQMH